MQTDGILGFWLKQTMQSVSNAFTDVLQTACATLDKPCAITPPQFFTLGLLEREPDLPTGVLAQHLALDASVVTGIIKRLEQQGLVERVHDRTDYRLVRLHLTAEGHKLIQVLSSVAITFNQRLLQGFSQEEQAKLLEQLARIRATALSIQEDTSHLDASSTSSR